MSSITGQGEQGNSALASNGVEADSRQDNNSDVDSDDSDTDDGGRGEIFTMFPGRL